MFSRRALYLQIKLPSTDPWYCGENYKALANFLTYPALGSKQGSVVSNISSFY